MRLVTFTRRGHRRIGVVDPERGEVIDLSLAAPRLPGDMVGLIERGPAGLAMAARALKTRKREARIRLSRAKLLAPIPEPPRNVMCVGKNYHDHAGEFHASGFDATAGKTAVPPHPIIFTKAANAIIGTGAPIPGHLDPTRSVDYEAELGVVIGVGGRRIPKKAAYDHVFGYTIINDVTARHLQERHRQWFIGKSMDGFCPMGPWLVTADEVGDVRRLRVRCSVNGEPRQDALVGDLIFDIPALIKTLSAGMTLCPGDVIATGTPAGVGIGFDPPQFLRRGDVVRVSIDGLGTLENPVA